MLPKMMPMAPPPKSTTTEASGRRDPRYRVRLPVVVTCGKHKMELFTADISLRGFFLRTDRPIKDRQFVRTDLLLPPGEDRVSLFGMVAHAVLPNNPHNRIPGSGIQLYGNGAEALVRWEKFIRFVAEKYPSALEQEVVISPTHAETSEEVRRAYQRFELRMEVKVYFDKLDQLVLMYSRDISKGGVFLRTDAQLEVGQVIELRLIHPNSREEFTLHGVVRRNVRDAAAQGQRGIGIEFVELDEHRRTVLWDFVVSGSEAIPVEDAFLITEDEPESPTPTGNRS